MKLPLGRQDFASLIQDGCVYIDKTETICNLVTNLKYVFLSRPRRFGKSLTISTLDYLFQGKKELFKGLWIYNHWNWKETNPVIRIDFSSIGERSLGLKNAIEVLLNEIANKYKIKIINKEYDKIFDELIKKMQQKFNKNLVILIDEYDAPIVNYIDVDSSKMLKAQENREILREFYKVLKSNDGYIRFFMFTGITRVVKMNLFSALNNVKDISFSNEYAALTGYTEKEILHYFTDEIKNIQLQTFPELNFQQLIEKIRYWYNGYNFGGKQTMYNPFTFLNFIFDKEFKSFWIGTGESSLLIKTFQENNFNSLTFLNKQINIQDDFNIQKLNPITLLYQTGYITVKKLVDEFTAYMDYPNNEVKLALTKYILTSLVKNPEKLKTILILEIAELFKKNKPTQALKKMASLVKSIPARLLIKNNETVYHIIFHSYLILLGNFVQSEVDTANGKPDSVIYTDDRIFIIEYKINKAPEIALQQIHKKKYAQSFLHLKKPITCIGIGFNNTDRSMQFVVE